MATCLNLKVHGLLPFEVLSDYFCPIRGLPAHDYQNITRKARPSFAGLSACHYGIRIAFCGTSQASNGEERSTAMAESHRTS